MPIESGSPNVLAAPSPLEPALNTPSQSAHEPANPAQALAADTSTGVKNTPPSFANRASSSASRDI